MDPTKLRIPLSLVVAALGIAAGSGGTVAVASAKQADTAAQVAHQGTQIDGLSKESQAARERMLRVEMLVEQTSKTVERIDRKLDRQGRDHR